MMVRINSMFNVKDEADAPEPVADPDLHRVIRRMFEEPDGDLFEQQQRRLDVFRVGVVLPQVLLDLHADLAERLQRQVIFDDLFLSGHRPPLFAKLISVSHYSTERRLRSIRSLLVLGYAKMGARAAASLSLWACASARSAPLVV